MRASDVITFVLTLTPTEITRAACSPFLTMEEDVRGHL